MPAACGQGDRDAMLFDRVAGARGCFNPVVIARSWFAGRARIRLRRIVDVAAGAASHDYSSSGFAFRRAAHSGAALLATDLIVTR